MRIVLVGNSDAVASPARFCASALRTLGHDLQVASPRRGAGEPKLVLPPSRDVDLLLYIDRGYLEEAYCEQILVERRRYEERWRALFREGVESGGLRTDLDDPA